ncbi:hypothetical protein [Nocardiopsis alborubida]|uniref:Uncharacterized protein n=1 Tax=Nocardiopsis alborubida TaxID=146802 RepID=A0A7X6MDG9_9ACTN|nr:hypothetical protein [Nocardiopsis alborubida]NKY99496.1 hypothetical protein [Nocardiopsis alborubida]
MSRTWSRNAPLCAGAQAMTGPGTSPVASQRRTRASRLSERTSHISIS